jgi:hypothetical protein
VCFRNEGSGAKQCSGFEEKISKSELCTGTTEEVQVQISAVVPKERYLLRFISEGSGAKQCSGFEEKISKSKLCAGSAEEVLYVLFLRSEGFRCTAMQ